MNFGGKVGKQANKSQRLPNKRPHGTVTHYGRAVVFQGRGEIIFIVNGGSQAISTTKVKHVQRADALEGGGVMIANTLLGQISTNSGMDHF